MVNRIPVKVNNDGKTLINLGSGDWECDGWTNLDYSSKLYSKIQKRHRFVEYDIRHDKIPYEDDSVDCIYCSHVIEHIENGYDEKMLEEYGNRTNEDGENLTSSGKSRAFVNDVPVSLAVLKSPFSDSNWACSF